MDLENNTPLHLALNKLTPMMDGLEDYEDLDMDMDMDMDVCMVKEASSLNFKKGLSYVNEEEEMKEEEFFELPLLGMSKNFTI